MVIKSVSLLANYLTTQGVNILKRDKNSLQVTDSLFLVVDGDYVIPTGYDDNNKWLSTFTNDISNLLITYVV